MIVVNGHLLTAEYGIEVDPIPDAAEVVPLKVQPVMLMQPPRVEVYLTRRSGPHGAMARFQRVLPGSIIDIIEEDRSVRLWAS